MRWGMCDVGSGFVSLRRDECGIVEVVQVVEGGLSTNCTNVHEWGEVLGSWCLVRRELIRGRED